MGKGDKKSKKGKRFLGSYGVTRKQKSATVIPAEKPKTPKPTKAAEAVEEKPVAKRSTEQGGVKAPKKEAAEPKPKAPKKEPAAKKEAAPKAEAKKKTKEE